MEYSKLEKWQRRDIDLRIELGEGVLVDVPIKVLVEDVDPETQAVKRRIESMTRQYYVGMLNPDTTIPVLQIVASSIFGLADVQSADGGLDLTALLKNLKGDHLRALLAAILGETPAWVDAQFSPRMVLKVLAPFFSYNDFFALIRDATDFMVDMGVVSRVTEEETAAVPTVTTVTQELTPLDV